MPDPASALQNQPILAMAHDGSDTITAFNLLVSTIAFLHDASDSFRLFPLHQFKTDQNPLIT